MACAIKELYCFMKCGVLLIFLLCFPVSDAFSGTRNAFYSTMQGVQDATILDNSEYQRRRESEFLSYKMTADSLIVALKGERADLEEGIADLESTNSNLQERIDELMDNTSTLEYQLEESEAPFWMTAEGQVLCGIIFMGLLGLCLMYLKIRQNRSNHQFELDIVKKSKSLLERTLDAAESKLREAERKLASTETDFIETDSFLKSTQSNIQILEAELDEARGNYESALQKINSIKTYLKERPIINDYEQPVILMGPRAVGKTSLMMHLHSPSIIEETSATTRVSNRVVPIRIIEEEMLGRFPPLPELVRPVQSRLSLKVYDFPGELSQQTQIGQIIIEETHSFNQIMKKRVGKKLGIAIICMFDAEEAIKGITPETREYYSSQLFHNLRRLIEGERISVSKLVIVYNKIDMLRRARNLTVNELASLCREKFRGLCDEFKDACNQSRPFEVGTILKMSPGSTNNQGAHAIMAETSRPMVDAFLNEDNLDKLYESVRRGESFDEEMLY